MIITQETLFEFCTYITTYNINQFIMSPYRKQHIYNMYDVSQVGKDKGQKIPVIVT